MPHVFVPCQREPFNLPSLITKGFSGVSGCGEVILATLLVISAGAVSAEAYKKRYSDGIWALYRVDRLELRAPNGQYELIDKLCLAAYTSLTASLKFAMAPAAVAARRPSLRDYICVEIASKNWNFRKRTASAGLSAQISSYTERGAHYDGFGITLGAPDFKKNFVMFLMFAGSRETIDVLGRRGGVIARFPANGFSRVRDKLFACAGSKFKGRRNLL